MIVLTFFIKKKKKSFYSEVVCAQLDFKMNHSERFFVVCKFPKLCCASHDLQSFKLCFKPNQKREL